jgi:Asp-tRNA(Asn)/Glu-tRNA(Gln) amidotransferase A subunit family amidase
MVEDAPCHVQVVGRRLKDESLIQAAALVEKALRL